MTTSGASRKSAEAFRTISEVAEALRLPQHVLRFWETRFVQIKPLKRAGGRRFYRPEDVELLGAIRQLLYGEGYTIKGVQRILREQGPRAVAALARQATPPAPGLAAVPIASDPIAEDEARDEANDASEASRWPESVTMPSFLRQPDVSPASPPARTRSFPPRDGSGPSSGPAVATSVAAQLALLVALRAELDECRRLLDDARG